MSQDAAVAVRMMRDVQVMGEVAGSAAALAVQSEVPSLRLLDIGKLKELLTRRGVACEIEHLSRLKTGKGLKQWSALPAALANESMESYEGYLSGMGTKSEPQALAWWQKKELDPLVLLGTPGEGKALWSIYCHPRKYKTKLKHILSEPNDHWMKRRGSALALMMIGCHEGLDEVVRAVRYRDDDILSGRRPYPRWLAALTLLELSADTRPFDVMLDIVAGRLHLESSAVNTSDRQMPKGTPLYSQHPWVPEETLQIGAILFALRYFERTIYKLHNAQRLILAEQLEELISWGVGDDYMLFGDRRQVCSWRWSVETIAAGILARCKSNIGLAVLRKYMVDERAFVRNAALERWRAVLK